MKRVTNACLLQTIKFENLTAAETRKEYKKYLKDMDMKNIKYVIEEEKEDERGTIFIKIKKQYNDYSLEGYIN